MNDVTSLSTEELEELIAKKQTDTKKRVSYDGLELMLDPKRAASWQALKLQTKIADPKATDAEKAIATMDYMEFIFGDQLDKIVEHCGGDLASAESIGELAAHFMEQLTKK